MPIGVREDARAILASHYPNPEVDLNEARLRMARIPEGATLIDNPVSQGPGLLLGNVHVMAGVPAVFQAMVAGLLPRLTGGRPLLSETVRIDRPEGEIAGPLRQIAEAHPDGLDRQLPVQHAPPASAPTSSPAARTPTRSPRPPPRWRNSPGAGAGGALTISSIPLKSRNRRLAAGPRLGSLPLRSRAHAGIDLVNASIFVGAALVLVGMLSSLVATRFGAPLLLVFLVVGMLAGEDGPGGIMFNDYRATYLVGMIALSVILFDGGLRTRLSAFRGVLAPSLLLATVGVLLTAAIAGVGAWWALGLAPVEGLLLGAIIASTDAAAVFFLIRTGGLRLPHRVGSTLEIESSTNDPVSVFLVILLTELLLAHGSMSAWELVAELVARGACSAPRSASPAAPALVAILNRVAMPGGLHPLFVVAGAITLAGFTMVVGGSGLLAVYIAGPRDGEPPDAGLSVDRRLPRRGHLALPDRDVPRARPARHPVDALDLRRPGPVRGAAADASSPGRWRSGSASAPFGFSLREKLFVSWVGLRGAVSIFLAAIPQLAGLPNAGIYFNIAFFVVLLSLLVQGSTLNAAARRLGVALRQTTPSAIRVEIDVPGQTEQEIVGYPVTAESIILGLSRPPAWARVVMVVRKAHILEPAEAGALQPGDYAYFLVSRQRLPRLDSLFRTSRDVARRLGLLFGELAIRGEAMVDELGQLYDLDFGPHAPGVVARRLDDRAAERQAGARRHGRGPAGDVRRAPARGGSHRRRRPAARRADAGRARRKAARAPRGGRRPLSPASAAGSPASRRRA